MCKTVFKKTLTRVKAKENKKGERKKNSITKAKFSVFLPLKNAQYVYNEKDVWTLGILFLIQKIIIRTYID